MRTGFTPTLFPYRFCSGAHKTVITFLATCIIIPVLQAASVESVDTSSPTDALRTFVEAFKKQNTEAMQKYFSDEVLFSGEHRFIDREEPLDAPVVLAGKELTAKYSKLFEKIGEKRWSKLADTFQLTTEKLENENDYGAVGKAGDSVLRLKGGPNELDEAIVFIYRETVEGIEIVGHYADY